MFYCVVGLNALKALQTHIYVKADLDVPVGRRKNKDGGKFKIPCRHTWWIKLNYCSLFIKDPVECYTIVTGTDYRGKVNTTEGGKVCQKWTDFSPHNHTYTEEKFPFSGLGDHNYCRKPNDQVSERAWCYTMDVHERYDYCDIGAPREFCETGKLQM